MKLKGRIKDLNLAFLSGKPQLTLEIDEKSALLAEVRRIL